MRPSYIQSCRSHNQSNRGIALGYGRFGGSKATAKELSEIFRLMEANRLLTQSRLLTGMFYLLHEKNSYDTRLISTPLKYVLLGYIPGAEALAVIADLAKKLRASSPHLIYLLDRTCQISGSSPSRRSLTLATSFSKLQPS